MQLSYILPDANSFTQKALCSHLQLTKIGIHTNTVMNDFMCFPLSLDNLFFPTPSSSLLILDNLFFSCSFLKPVNFTSAIHSEDPFHLVSNSGGLTLHRQLDSLSHNFAVSICRLHFENFEAPGDDLGISFTYYFIFICVYVRVCPLTCEGL